MPRRQLIERVCFPTVVISTIAAVLLYICVIWAETPILEDPALTKLAATAMCVALGSGFLLSATRVAEGHRRDVTTSI